MNLRFTAFYYERYGAIVGNVDTVVSIFLALVTSASAGAWLATDSHPKFWACVIGVAQAIAIAKKFVPSLRKPGEYVRCALAYEKAYFAMEAVWRECEEARDEALYRKAMDQLRDKQMQVEVRYCELPVGEWLRITQWARRRLGEFVALNFPSDHEQFETSAASGTSTTGSTASSSAPTVKRTNADA